MNGIQVWASVSRSRAEISVLFHRGCVLILRQQDLDLYDGFFQMPN